MTGTLAFVGGAEFTDGCSHDLDLLATSGAEEVLVVPAAAAYENPAKLLDRAERWFAHLGVRTRALPVYRRAEALEPEAAAAVRGARFVYLTDGASMHLRSVLKDTPLLDALVAAWADGAVLAGSGAGAVVACDHMVDERGGAFGVGLGLIHALTVIPHFDRWSPDKAHRTVSLAPGGLPVVGIPERTALVHHDGSWQVLGAGSVEVFVGHQRADLDQLPAQIT